MHRLENPARVQELNPPETLKRIGLKPGDSFLDVGAGTGLFAFEAARLTGAAVYAVEISEGMLRILAEKKESTGLENVRITEGVENAPDGACDLAMLSTVLHELSEPDAVLRHIRRALKPGGRLAVIEFHDRPTPMGPPPSIRLSQARVLEILNAAGFQPEGTFTLGENMYCLTALSPAQR
jgi:ubiquinone/menaquinone biosynthesis C-methylase UbiE